MRTSPHEETARIDGAVRGHENITGDYVLAAGAAHPHHVPGIVNLDVGARHYHVYQRCACFGISASQHHPMRMVHTAAELPTPVDAVAAIDGGRDALP